MADNRRRVGSENGKSSKREHTYIEGNTIRKVQAQPVRREEYENPRRLEPKRKVKKKPVSKEVRRNREKAKSVNFFYVAGLMIAGIVLVLTCAKYIDTKSEMLKMKEENESLENEITNSKIINDATYNSLISSVNLAEITQIALEQFKMVPVSEGQVVFYDYQNTDYVRQYKAVE